MGNKIRPWLGDADYHDRHARRSLNRAQCIAKAMSDCSTFLDVGCNKGIISEHLLHTGKIQNATGIEMASNAVSDSLVDDRRFRLIQGDVSDLEIKHRFDVVFYGAVHHHIVRERGIGKAVDTLRKLVRICDKHLFFETGHLTEGSRWAWQRSIRKYFRTDEEHIFFLLLQIEPYVSNFSIIGRFFIHGIRRWLIKIDIKQDDTNRMTPSSWRAKAEQPYVPKRQYVDSLILSHSALAQEVGTTYRALKENASKYKLFLKTRPHQYHVTADEYKIALQVKDHWAVKPIDLTPQGELVFPFISGKSLSLWAKSGRTTRNILARHVRNIYDSALRKSISVEPRLLIPTPARVSLLQLIDINPNNFLVSNSENELTVYVIDYERQSNHYLWKNRIHIARILFQLRSYIGFALLQFCIGIASGIAYLCRYQFVDPRQRIIDRQPSLFSFITVEFRSFIGRLIIRLIPKLSER